jgi:chaperonin GroEL
MPAKEIIFDDQARVRIGRGLDALAEVVKVTLGPRGRTVLLAGAWGAPSITRDGVSVAKEIELGDRFENLGAQMVKEVASRTADVAGDGTTTAIVLAQSIYAEGLKLVTAGADPMELRGGIELAVAAVSEALEGLSVPVSRTAEIAQVGTISGNGDATIGRLIAEAMDRVGREGVITVEQSQSMDTTLEVVDGMRLDRGYLSPYFVSDAKRMEAVLDRPLVFIYEKKLSNAQKLLPLLERVAEANRALLIIAEDIDGDALATLVTNKLRGTLQVCAIKAPGFGARRGELLGDIGVLTGQILTAQLGGKIEDLTLEDLGHASKIIVDKDHTTIIGGGGSKRAVQARCGQLRSQIELESSDYDREKLQERLARLVGGVAVIEVGAATEIELMERKARFEDALHATRAAVEEGIVPGGGVALLRAIPALDSLALGGDRQLGVAIVRRALEEPLRQMAANAGVEGAIVVDGVRKGAGAYGYNVATMLYEDLLAAGVADPTKVVRVALQNAASVAALMLTTEALIVAG